MVELFALHVGEESLYIDEWCVDDGGWMMKHDEYYFSVNKTALPGQARSRLRTS